MTVRVKICGVTRAEDAAAAIESGADFIGLNFVATSPRCLTPEEARAVRDAIGERATAVGVFVNAPRDTIEDCCREFKLGMIQFSGDEDDAALGGWPIKTIAACRLGADTPPAARQADFTLYDAYDSSLRGGTGRRIALGRLRGLDLARAFVAGGLTPDNVGEVAALNPFAVDCASGVESAPGIKDHDKLRSFIVNAKRAR